MITDNTIGRADGCSLRNLAIILTKYTLEQSPCLLKAELNIKNDIKQAIFKLVSFLVLNLLTGVGYIVLK